MKQKQRKKSRAATKKIFSFFHLVTGPGIVGFTGSLNKSSNKEVPIINAGTTGQDRQDISSQIN